MQNKGFVKTIAVLLFLTCCFYFSFSFVTNHYEKKAAEITATQGVDAGIAYLDSMRNEKVYLGWKTLKECEELEIGLGLDLKGGMNVILEVSVPDVVKNLAGEQNAKDADLLAAVSKAKEGAKKGEGDFVDLFVKAYQEIKGENKLGGIFATKLKEKGVSYTSTDEEVKKVLIEEIEAAVANSNEVVRSRIDRFGVAQPNIQILRGKGQMGQIMVEMPGIKEPERVRNLLQGSANLEFWETYNISELQAAIQTVAQIEVPFDTTTTKLFNHLAVAPYESCILGYAKGSDTLMVNTILATEKAQAAFPKDLRFSWSVKPEQGNFYALYLLKQTNGEPALAGDVIADAKDDFDQTYHRPIVSMTMTTQGGREWANITRKILKRCVAIVLDGYVYSAPVIQTEINGGISQISGNFTTDDTRDLANVLKSGKMPAPAKIVQEETVGPSLGQASIEAGFTACAVAFVVLMIFMCLYYGFIPGMVANAALILNFFFTFGVLISYSLSVWRWMLTY